MNIYNKNWAQYEYSYNLANSRENWAQKKNSIRDWPLHGIVKHVLRVTAHPQILALELQAPGTIRYCYGLHTSIRGKKDRQCLVDTGGKGKQKLYI